MAHPRTRGLIPLSRTLILSEAQSGFGFRSLRPLTHAGEQASMFESGLSREMTSCSVAKSTSVMQRDTGRRGYRCDLRVQIAGALLEHRQQIVHRADVISVTAK